MNRGALPPNYREVRYWRLAGNRWLFLGLNASAVAALVIFGAFFLWFAARFGGLQDTVITGNWLARAPVPDQEPAGAGAQVTLIGANWMIGLIAGLLLTLVLHELAHGLAMKAFGAQPKYGVLWRSLVAYATAPGHAFTRGEYLTVSLAPLVSLSALALLVMAVLAGLPLVFLLALCASFNAAGAAGDLWMSAIVARYPADAYIVDERDGMRIFLPA